MNDFGDELKSSIFIGDDAFSASCFNFNCSTAEGFADNFCLFVAFKSNLLKSFSEVLGTPSRSLQVVVWALIGLPNVTCEIDELLPKPLSPIFCVTSFSPFNGVDVLNVHFDDFGDANFFTEPIFSGNVNLWRLRFDFGRFLESFDLARFSHEKRRFTSFDRFWRSLCIGHVSDFVSRLESLNSGKTKNNIRFQ